MQASVTVVTEHVYVVAPQDSQEASVEKVYFSVFTQKDEIFDLDNFNPTTSNYFLLLAAVILLKYCRYGVKHYPINSSFCYLDLLIVYRVSLLVIWIELCVQM